MKTMKATESLIHKLLYKIIMKIVNIYNFKLFIVNRQCEYHEFKDIMKAAFLEDCESPIFRWKHKYLPILEERETQEFNAEDFAESEVFILFLTSADV